MTKENVSGIRVGLIARVGRLRFRVYNRGSFGEVHSRAIEKVRVTSGHSIIVSNKSSVPKKL